MISPLRRARLASALVLLCASVFPSRPATAADSVSLRLDWTLTGYQSPFYWAKQKGYYTGENLDVEIKQGADSGDTVSLIAGQQDDIGFADSTPAASKR